MIKNDRQYNIVMNKDIAGFFDRFFVIALKDYIQDPLVHAQWAYFQSMMTTNSFERDRVNMYLSVLQNQKNKKQNNQITPQKGNKATNNDLMYQPQYNGIGFKLEKRYSEPFRSDYAVKYNQTTNKQPRARQLRQKDYGIVRSPKISTPNILDQNNKNIQRLLSDQKQNYVTLFRGKEQKVDLRRMCDASSRLLAIFHNYGVGIK